MDLNKIDQKIPKIIIQTYKKNKLPYYYEKIVNNNLELNPDYEYMFFNDNECLEFIENNYDKRTLDAYKKINPKYGACKADFFRYCAMYKYGGVYLDIKSKINESLDNLIKKDDEFILSHWKKNPWSKYVGLEKGEFQNWHILCIPKHPFLKEVINDIIINIENYSLKEYPPSKKSVLFLTGPVQYTRSIIPLLNNYKHRICKEYNCNKILEYSTNNIHVEIEGDNHYSKQKEEIIII